jgi:hypothetical protein
MNQLLRIMISVCCLYALTACDLNPTSNNRDEARPIENGQANALDISGQTNLVNNPSFESGETEWLRISATGGHVVSNMAHTGASSLELTQSTTLTRAAYQDIAVVPGSSYTFSTYIKTDKLSGSGIKVKLYWLPASETNDPPRSYKRIDIVGIIAGTNSWRALGGTFVAPAGSNVVRIRYSMDIAPYATGTKGWIDSVNLTVAGSTSAPTPAATPAPTPAVTPVPTFAPTPVPTPVPTAAPTPVSTPKPTPAPTPVATPTPTTASCTIPPMGGVAHAYFDTLARRPEYLCGWTLRSQSQLDNLVAQGPSTFFTYNPAGDNYSNAKDAAKLLVANKPNTASIPTTQQVRMNVPPVMSGSLIFSWDWYWGPEFLANHGNMNHYKMFHFITGGHAWWTLMHSPAWAGLAPTGPGEVGKAWDSVVTPSGYPNGMIAREPLQPAGLGTPDQKKGGGEQTPIFHSRWYRYWVEVKLFQPPSAFSDWNASTGAVLQPNPNDPQGRWHMVSQWIADENGSVRRLMYRVPMGWAANWSPHISRFDLEMNSSQSTAGYTFVGPLVGYARNVIILRNYNLPSVPETDSLLFQRPMP